MITLDRLMEVLIYDQNSGKFYWKITTGRAKIGKEAGSISVHRYDRTNYLKITVDRVCYRAHILAWIYMTGEYPTNTIDHKDLNGLNNKWSNLRLATVSQNKLNGRKMITNTSGYKGVSVSKEGNFRARIGIENKRKCLGTYNTAEEAHEAYIQAARKLAGEFARGA